MFYVSVVDTNNELSIKLEELLNTDSHGKWWLIGSAWAGPSADSVVKGTKLIRNVITIVHLRF